MDSIKLAVLLLLVASSSVHSIIKREMTEDIETSENTKRGKLIANICHNARRFYPDIPEGDNYHYKFRSSHKKYFTFDEEICSLKISRPIDLENICKTKEHNCDVIPYTVNIFEMDVLKATITGKIKIVDVNDNVPRFHGKKEVLRIKEELVQKGTQYDLPVAIDNDYTNHFSKIIYHVDREFRDFEFEVDNDSGRPSLKLRNKLDRETRANYTFTLFASDTDGKSANITIVVIVENVDDNPPKFKVPLYVLDIPEDTPVGKQIFQLKADDRDTPANELKYSMSVGGGALYSEVFKIHSDGRVTVTKPLDYEKIKEYKVPVKVQDTSGTSHGANLKIKISDVNDNAPEYQVNPETLSVVEGSSTNIGDSIGEIAVWDNDEDKKAKFQCHQSGGTEDVEIRSKERDGHTFEIRPQHSFDREKQSIIIAQLRCIDSGKPKSRSSNKTIRIYVTDINDNSPVFTQSNYTARLEEEKPIRSYVLAVKATDPDLGKNGRITYRFRSHHNNGFYLDSKTGLITTMRHFDREERANYQFTVIATDNGNPKRTATAQVKIIIMDINDNAPKLTSRTRFSVKERRPIGTHVGDLTAEDRDEGLNGTIRFQISPALTQQSMRIGDLFEVFPNGSIYTRRVFDREETSGYRMSITMTDGSKVKPQVTVQSIVIEVLDENDNRPIFQKPLNESAIHRISIEDPPGQVILLVKATDRDLGRNGEVRYILTGDKRHLFSIDQITGQIKLRKSLSAADKGLYKLAVNAKDQGKPSLSTVHVVIIKVEDGPPRLFAFDWHDNRNVLIVVILSTVSAFLAIVLISAIICMVRPCGRSRRSPNILYKPATDDTWSPHSPDTRILQLPRVSNSGMSGPSNVTIGMCVDSARPECRGRLGSVTGSGTMPRKVRNPSNSLTRMKMDDNDHSVRMWQYDPERARTQAVMGRVPGEHDRDHSDSGRGGSEDDLSSRVAAAGIGTVTSGPILQTFQTIDRHHGLVSQSPMHPGGPPPVSGLRMPVSSTATLPSVKSQPQVVHIPLTTTSSSNTATMPRDCPTATYTQLSTLTRRGPNVTSADSPAASVASGQNNLSGTAATSTSSSGSSTGSSAAYERLHHRFPSSRVEPPLKETAIIDASLADVSSSNKVDAHKLVEEIDNLFFKDMMV